VEGAEELTLKIVTPTLGLDISGTLLTGGSLLVEAGIKLPQSKKPTKQDYLN
jgi:hypothetical protein